MIIAIDGPSGAGKSSVAKEVARRQGYSCLDTGAMYRCVAWLALRKGISLDDADALGRLACECVIEFGHEPNNPIPSKVLVDGVDVTASIRTSEIDKAVSPVSAAPTVRSAMVDQQRRIGESGDYVIEGRDIGTVVFPNAEVKVFLTASDEERAKRRVKQNEQRGIGSCDYDEVLADIRRRDECDSTRKTSPLKPAEGSHLIDSSDMSIEEVIDEICALACSRSRIDR